MGVDVVPTKCELSRHCRADRTGIGKGEAAILGESWERIIEMRVITAAWCRSCRCFRQSARTDDAIDQST